jgi:hypothetical protein
MMGPWFIELLARNGDVLQRQCVDKLPIRIGRGYGNDVILDDDYAAASHAIVEADAAGHLVLRDLGSRNGIVVAGRRRQDAVLAGDTVVRIGHTSLRVRAADCPVAPELVDHTLHGWEGVLPGAVGLLLTASIVLLARWLSDAEFFESARYAEALAGGLAAALLWGGAWAFANRLFGRHARLGRHLFVFGCGITALAGWIALGCLLAYAFSAESITHYGSHLATVLLAGIVYFHLSTIRPRNRVRFRWICACLAVLSSSLILAGNVQRTGRFSDELYMSVLLPPAMRMSPDHGVDEFMRDVEAMKGPLDRSRGRKPGEDQIDD